MPFPAAVPAEYGKYFPFDLLRLVSRLSMVKYGYRITNFTKEVVSMALLRKKSDTAHARINLYMAINREFARRRFL